MGAGPVGQARSDAASAEAQLDVVLERQASLAPQLVALAGGRGESLSGLSAEVRDAESMAERLAASDALALAMATELGALPPPSSEADTQLRLNLQYEVSGSQNRVTVEARRYREALARWEVAAGTPSGRLAIALGLADAPR